MCQVLASRNALSTVLLLVAEVPVQRGEYLPLALELVEHALYFLLDAAPHLLHRLTVRGRYWRQSVGSIVGRIAQC
jgi:hypothetical protein